MAYKKVKKNLSKGEELTLAKQQWNQYTRARDNGHDDYIDMAKKCDAFYRGDQWDEADMSMLYFLLLMPYSGNKAKEEQIYNLNLGAAVNKTSQMCLLKYMLK